MLTEFNNSKEVIKNRMLKHALNYWSIKNVEDLDPMVKLIWKPYHRSYIPWAMK
jgi:hypothetical protein